MGTLDDIIETRPIENNSMNVSTERILQQEYVDCTINQFHQTGRVGSEQQKYLPDVQLVRGENRTNAWAQEGVPHSYTEAFKQIFGMGETIGQRVYDHVVQGLTPVERKNYNDEELDRHNFESGNLRIPMPPRCRMHDEVNLRVLAIENEITQSVNAKLTPEQIKSMEWERQRMGPEEWGNERYVGPAIKKYYKDISAIVDEKFPQAD